jgi:hypothetical protein
MFDRREDALDREGGKATSACTTNGTATMTRVTT